MVRWAGWSRLNDGTGNPAPAAQLTVYLKGTNILASLYSQNLVSPSTVQANPFTAGGLTSGSPGFAFFYAPNGRYDVAFQGGGMVAPYTLADIALYDPGTIGS